MSGTNDGYVEIDFDSPKTASKGVDDFEIIVEDQPTTEVEVTEEPRPVAQPAAKAAPESDEEDDEVGEAAERKRLTRTQRLKLARDNFKQQLEEERAKREAAEARARELEEVTQQSAAEGYDFYIATLDDKFKGLRAEFDAAFNEGDKDKLFRVQEAMATLAAQREAAKAERARMGPTKRGSGGEAQQPTPQTTSATDRPEAPKNGGSPPNPLVAAWVQENSSWFNKDRIMTVAAGVIERELIDEGSDPNDPEHYEEVTKRLREAFPHKFEQAAPKTRQPIVNTRPATPAPNGKIQIRLTAEDMRTIQRLGITKEAYARQKARYEQAQINNNGYTEI